MKRPFKRDWRPGHCQVQLWMRTETGSTVEFSSVNKTHAEGSGISSATSLALSIALGLGDKKHGLTPFSSVERKTLIDTVHDAQRGHCAYDDPTRERAKPVFCDCKAKDVGTPNSEMTGCFELRVVKRLLERISDEEMRIILGRKAQ